MKKIIARFILILWDEYRHSKEGCEAPVPDGLPVFNATNFMYWLKNKYK